jgi:hypothetical protein
MLFYDYMDFSKVGFSVLFRAYLYITLAAVLVTVFVASVIQGVLMQVGEKNLVTAIVFYLVAWFCLGAGAILFFKGKSIVRDIVISW